MVIRKDRMLLNRMSIRLSKFSSELTKQPQLRSLKKNILCFANKVESLAQKATPAANKSIKKTYQVTQDLVDSAIALTHRRKNTEKKELQNKNVLNINHSGTIKAKLEHPMYSNGCDQRPDAEPTHHFSQTQEPAGLAEECLTCPELVGCVYRQNMTIQSIDLNTAPCHFTNERS
jgi:hypothetical protein